MVTAVTNYKANDGKVFETEQQAIDHETTLIKESYANTIASRLLNGVTMNDRRPVINAIHSLFSNKNGRKMIRDFLVLCVEPGND